MKTAAFFDLDGTVLAVNSGALWVKRELRCGRITRAQYLHAMLYLLAYRLRTIDMTAAMRKALATIAGEREDAVREWTREWYRSEVAHHVTPGARAAIDRHRYQGHVLVLLTTSSPYAAQMAAQQLALDAVVSSVYQVHEGVFTGDVVHPICYGEGKVRRAEAFAEQQQVRLEASHFYTDSVSDLPMLDRVGFPHVVNPDFGLRQEARRRGWPILDWRQRS